MSFTKTQLRSLRDRWETLEQEGCGWASFEAFTQWAEVSGFQTNKGMFKLNQRKPHGPGTSYWYDQHKELPDVISPFCENCGTDCANQRVGCFRWREYFVRNWNENIYVPPANTADPGRRQVFRYEHPDLVREGIVFEMRTV